MKFWAALVFVGLAAAAAGQTTNPRVVQFVPSADNAALTSDGLPVVVRYELRFYDLAQSLVAPVRTVDLGKPAVGSDGTMQVDFSVLTAWPLPSGIYQTRVVAIGQTSQGQSDWSNVFAFQGSGGALRPPGGKPLLARRAL